MITHFPNHVPIITQDFNDFVGTEVLISQFQSWFLLRASSLLSRFRDTLFFALY